MTTDPAWALQQAIHTTLTGAAVLTDLLGGASIFDDVPPEAAFPYVTYGPSISEDWGTVSEEGREHLVALHVWTRLGGRGEAGAIIAAINAALSAAPIALAENHLVNLRYLSSETRRDPDGETFHGVVRFRAVTEPAP